MSNLFVQIVGALTMGLWVIGNLVTFFDKDSEPLPGPVHAGALMVIGFCFAKDRIFKQDRQDRKDRTP